MPKKPSNKTNSEYEYIDNMLAEFLHEHMPYCDKCRDSNHVEYIGSDVFGHCFL